MCALRQSAGKAEEGRTVRKEAGRLCFCFHSTFPSVLVLNAVTLVFLFFK